MKQKSELTNLYIFPVLVLGLHFFATYVVELYNIFPGFDVPMHFLGGMSIAYSAFYGLKLLQSKKLIGFVHPIVLVIILVSITALIAVGWEFFEFTLDHFLYHETHFQSSTIDTMKDLLMGLCGGYVIGALIFLKK